MFDRYEKEYGTRYREFEFDNKLQEEYNDNNKNKGMFEQVIRYDDGITSDFVLASCSVPVNYEYTKLNVQDYKLVSNEIL